MVLDKNPENFMEQVEKVAFSPSNLLDGAELSDDKMLQGALIFTVIHNEEELVPNFAN
ncbi:catalase [Bacillus cereus]